MAAYNLAKPIKINNISLNIYLVCQKVRNYMTLEIESFVQGEQGLPQIFNLPVVFCFWFLELKFHGRSSSSSSFPFFGPVYRNFLAPPGIKHVSN